MNVSVRTDEQHGEPLRVEVVEPRPDVIVVKLVGDIDMLTAPLLHDRLNPLLDRADRVVLIDLSEVAFLGSAGLSVLATAKATAHEHDSRMMLVANSRAVIRPLEVTGLHPLFQIFDSIESALGEL